MTRLRALSLFVVLSAITVVTFQNCGQAGEVVGIETRTASGQVFSNSLEITEPVDGLPDNTDGSELPPPTGGGGADQSPVPPTSPPPTADDDPKVGFNDIVHEGACAKIEATDVLLTIDRVDVASNSTAQFTVRDLEPSLSVAKNFVSLEATASGPVSEIRLVLASTGNFLMTMDQTIYGLKTPSGQASGFKIKLETPMTVEAGKNYQLTLNMDFSRQIVVAGKKCLLKPVIRSSVLAPL